MKVELSHHDLVARFIFPLIVPVRIIAELAERSAGIRKVQC